MKITTGKLLLFCFGFLFFLPQLKAQQGTPDTAFRGAKWFSNQADLSVRSIVLQPDRKILIAGMIRTPDDSFFGVMRLNPNGTIDSSLRVGRFNGKVNCIKTQSDGKIIIAGGFSTYGGVSKNKMVRVFPDGRLDSSFTPSGFIGSEIKKFIIQSDGKIIVCNQPATVRLMANGALDQSFGGYSGSGNLDAEIYSAVIQSDGKIILAGGFQNFWLNKPRKFIMRMNPDGTEDSTFGAINKFNLTIRTVALQSDGKILLWGDFSSYDGVACQKIVRLHPDGTMDTSFLVNFNGSYISQFAFQPDNKILVSGTMFGFEGYTRQGYSRLHPNGRLDTTFGISGGLTGTSEALALQPDGKVLYGGNFTYYNLNPHNRLIRLHGDSTWDDSATYYKSQASACDSFTWYGTTYTQSGTYHHDLTNSQGDDSLLVLELSLSYSSSNLEQVKTCGPYVWQGQTYSTPGTYTKTLTNAQGCDSNLVLDLTIAPINTFIAKIGNLLSSLESDSGVTYQWMNCATGQIIPNLITRIIQPPTDGTYAVIISKWGCIDTSECVSSGSESLFSPEGIEMAVYPNPAGKEITVDLPLNGESGKLILYNALGREVFVGQFQNEKSITLSTSELPAGVYWIIYQTAKDTYTAKFITSAK